LLPQGEVLEREMVVAAAQEREEPEQVEQEGEIIGRDSLRIQAD
jgi:hypothetical protein